MAPNMEEIKRPGRDMNEVQTEKELRKKGLVSDPIQQDK